MRNIFQFFPPITQSADLFVSRCSVLQWLFLSPPFENSFITKHIRARTRQRLQLLAREFIASVENPIYVGFLLVVVASAACANSAWLLLAAVALFIFLRFGVVSREEQYLSRKFGNAYEEYRRKVRRWI
jgi:protein-S-isoprenylcysteine O-methyltransferase Ste14